VAELLLIGICTTYNTNRTYLETGKGHMLRTTYPKGTKGHEGVVTDEGHTIHDITGEEQDLLEKVLFVVRGKWNGKFEVSLHQNIESFYSGAMAETGKDYSARIDEKPPPEKHTAQGSLGGTKKKAS